MTTGSRRARKKRPITLLAVHHEPAFHRRLRRSLGQQREIELLGALTPDDMDPLKAVRRWRPQVLLLERQLAEGAGDSLLPAIHRHSPRTKVLLLSDQYLQEEEIQAVKLGAIGYIGGDVTLPTLSKAVHVTTAGENWVRRKTASLILDDFLRLIPASS